MLIPFCFSSINLINRDQDLVCILIAQGNDRTPDIKGSGISSRTAADSLYPGTGDQSQI
jgi:hypothetical protein